MGTCCSGRAALTQDKPVQVPAPRTAVPRRSRHFLKPTSQTFEVNGKEMPLDFRTSELWARRKKTFEGECGEGETRVTEG